MCSFRMSDNNNNSNTQFFDPVDGKGVESEKTSGSESGSSIEEEDEGKKVLEGTSNGDELGKQIVVDDGDQDGYRTPTSEENRIPAIIECPPAPRKPRRSELKRRRSPEAISRRCLEFDELEEVESIFRRTAVPEIVEEGDGESEPENKKVRRDDDDDI